MLLFITSPLEQFEVTSFLALNSPLLGGVNFSLTNLGFYSLVVLVLSVGVHVLASDGRRLVPSR
jgi:F-type H+-transporting ATPase subunit a